MAVLREFNMKKRLVSFIKFSAFSLGILSALSSCKLFDDDVFHTDMYKFFKDYTETAVIYQDSANNSYLNDKDGHVCFDSSSSKSYSFLLRNPQHYLLNFGYAFDDGTAASKASEIPNAVSFYQPTYDPSSMTMTFSQEFLKAMDGGGNLSGKITLLEPRSYRSFDSYSMSFFANSPPPMIQNAQFQLSSIDPNDTGTHYYICFYLPDMSNSINQIHSSDTHKLLINTETYYFSGSTGSSVYKDSALEIQDTRFISPDPSDPSAAPTVYPLSDGGYEFRNSIAPEGYSPIYFNSEFTPPSGMETMTVSLTIIDDAGLSTPVAISNTAKQLSMPTFSFDNLEADEDTGLATFTINHDGTCTDGASCGGSVLINYVVLDSSNVIVKQGSSMNSATVYMPKGNYKVKAWAAKGYYVSSEVTDPTDFTVTQAAVFYVSEDGNDSENTGARGSPFRTIQTAIDKFIQGIADGEYESTDKCTIRIKTDLTVPDDFDFSTNGSYLIDTKGIYNFDFAGYGGRRTINMSGSHAQDKSIMNIIGGNVTIKDLSFTGVYSLSSGGIVMNISDGDVEYTDGEVYSNGGNYGGYINVQGGTFTMRRVSMRENHSDSGSEPGALGVANGAAAECYDCSFIENEGDTRGQIVNSGTLLLKNTSVKKGISTAYGSIGGGIYNTGTLTLDSCTVTENKAGSEPASGAGIYNEGGAITLKGKNTITGNTLLNGTRSNLYTNEPLTIVGNISGSKIGISMDETPTQDSDVTITSGYAYGSVNTAMPGAIFISEMDFGITVDDVSNEAIFSAGYSNISVTNGENLTVSYNNTVSAGGTVTITVKDASDTDITSECSFSSFTLIYASDVVSTDYYSTSSSGTLTFESTAVNGSYILYASFTYNGLTYDVNLPVTVE